MQVFRLLIAASTSAGISLLFSQSILAQTPIISITRNQPTEPLVLNGRSGGTVSSKCGNIPSAPSQVIQVTESLPYLRLTVESTGKPTLLIDGPGGRFCVMADNYSGGKTEMSGFWLPGMYTVYIGESSPNQQNYTLSISQKK